MGAYAKALLVATIVNAVTLSALVNSELSLLIPSWAKPVLAVAAVLIGPFVALALYASDAARASRTHRLDPRPDERPADGPPVRKDFFSDHALLGFTGHLMAATTSEGLLQTIQSQLPALIGGRKVWIVGNLPPPPPEKGAERSGVTGGASVSAEVQEWTTFPLRVENRCVGLLGVESAGGLCADHRHAIERLSALLARAVMTVSTINTFRQASLIDLLTGAATRREGLNRLQSEVKRAQRTGGSMAVLMLDLDHFKSVNDRFGHAVGDALLTAIGRTLRTTLRASDVRCRWGGEEFLVVLPDTDLARAQVVATHLLHNIARAAVPLPGGPVTTTASVGLTMARPGETSVNHLVARADRALYQAKREGRSCVRVALGDQDGKPIGEDGPRTGEPSTPKLHFADRRSPDRADRRSVPGSGRRRSDPVPSPFPSAATSSAATPKPVASAGSVNLGSAAGDVDPAEPRRTAGGSIR